MRNVVSRLLYSVALSIGIALSSGLVHAMPYTDVVIFGDSLSDPGNRFADSGVPPAPYFNGQLSNGPVWANAFAQHFGLNANPLSQGGHNYAYAGATTGATGLPNDAPTLMQQQAAYLVSNGGAADPNALYVVFGGGNDIPDAMMSGNLGLLGDGVSNIVTMIGTLYGAGARNVLVANLPNIGHTPRMAALGAGAQSLGTALALSWNAALNSALDGFSVLSDLDLNRLDMFSLEANVLANAAIYGYINTTEPCFDGVSICANPGEYYYWDGFHPTAQGHFLIAQAAINAIPEPATALLVGLGLIGLMARRSGVLRSRSVS